MRKYLETLLKEQHYPEISVRGILSTYDQIIENEETKTLLENVVHTYENSTFLRKEDIDGLVTEIAEKTTAHLFTIKLTCLLCMTKELARRLEAHGLDEQTIFLTIADFKFKSLETYDLYGIFGVSEWDWFFGFFQLERFAFGRLQFEIVKFRLPHYEKDGLELTEKSDVINVHIPKSDIPFTVTECMLAYEKAKMYFSNRFNTNKLPFVCWSWLLYPPNEQILPETSNIVQFMRKYDIIEMEEYGEAYNPVAHILFNREKMGDVATLPQDTSLRKRYAEFLQKGGKTGWGYGVFFL